MQTRMLGKLEIVFSYTTHFFLSSWRESRPGILFLTDPAGYVQQSTPLQVGQTWTPGSVHVHRGACLADHAIFKQVVESGTIAAGQSVDDANESSWAAFPLEQKDGSIQGVIGLILPTKELDFDLASYMRGFMPLILMGHDAYIQHAISQIVMHINQFEHYPDLVHSVLVQVADVINKGYCSAVKLDDKGYLLPQERLMADAADEKSAQHLGQIIPRFVNERIKPMKTEDNRFVIFPIYCEGKPLLALFLHIPADQPDLVYDEQDVAFIQQVGEKISYTLLRAINSDEMRRDVQKKEMLYQLTKKIQASIDVNEVLTEIMQSLQRLYPYFHPDLYLTVETNTTLPVKQLTFHNGEDETSSRAYLEGRLVVNYQTGEEQSVMVIAAPLLGKQGIYGVLQLTSTELVNISDYETDYISILAETAGTAFENAQLYQQSRNLIRELRLINEMAQQLNRSLNLDEILQFVTKMLLETFEAQYCAILRKVLDEDTLLVLSSSDPDHVGTLISASVQPLQDIFKNKQAIILANPNTETMPFSLIPFASLMAVPLLQESEVSGVLLVSDTRNHFFSFDDFKLLEIFGQHTSLAITNAMLHSEVERMVITDNLTGLTTRRYLNDCVQLSLENDGIGSLVLMDIDYFKKINDTYGHQVGDEVLIQVSNLIKRSIRDTDIAARWGGEELAVYLPRVDLPTALNVADRIRQCVQNETNPRVTISCGLAKWDKEALQNMSVESLFHHADIALYEAKRRGRNQICIS